MDKKYKIVFVPGYITTKGSYSRLFKNLNIDQENISYINHLNNDFISTPSDKLGTTTFNDILEDSINQYISYTKKVKKNKKILLMGDSMGGCVILYIIRYLLNNNLRLPDKIILHSPAFDMGSHIPVIKQNVSFFALRILRTLGIINLFSLPTLIDSKYLYNDQELDGPKQPENVKASLALSFAEHNLKLGYGRDISILNYVPYQKFPFRDLMNDLKKYIDNDNFPRIHIFHGEQDLYALFSGVKFVQKELGKKIIIHRYNSIYHEIFNCTETYDIRNRYFKDLLDVLDDNYLDKSSQSSDYNVCDNLNDSNSYFYNNSYNKCTYKEECKRNKRKLEIPVKLVLKKKESEHIEKLDINNNIDTKNILEDNSDNIDSTIKEITRIIEEAERDKKNNN